MSIDLRAAWLPKEDDFIRTTVIDSVADSEGVGLHVDERVADDDNVVVGDRVTELVAELDDVCDAVMLGVFV